MRSQIYFPIERAKAGEFNAMAALSEKTKYLVCPTVDIPPVQDFAAFDRLQSSTVRTLAQTWGTANELFLDLSRYDPDSVTPQGASFINRIFESARLVGLKAIPVAGPLLDRSGSTGNYLRSVAQIAARDGRGAAIRLPHDDFREFEKLNSVIDEIQRAISVADGNCDVFLDFGPVDKFPLSRAQVVEFLERAASQAIRSVAQRGFRSLIFCASSIPRSLGKSPDGGPVRIPNSEYQVWSNLIKLPSDRHVRFGDYAARYAHQSDKASKASPPARINLSTPDVHVLNVGESPTYRELARKVIEVPEFDAQSGAWGKHAVRDAADGRGGMGNAAEWVARDTHMHMETMTSAVKERLIEAGVDISPPPSRVDLFEQADLWI